MSAPPQVDKKQKKRVYVKRPNKRRTKKKNTHTTQPKTQINIKTHKIIKTKQIKKYNNTHVHILIYGFQINTLIKFLHTYPNLNKKFKCKKDTNGQISFDEFKRFWTKHIDLPPDIIPRYKEKLCDDLITGLDNFDNDIEIFQSNYKCFCYDITRSHTYKTVLYLDRKAYGHTNQRWGGTDAPTIIRYAQMHNLPIADMLIKLKPLYADVDYNKIKKCKLFIL